MSVKKSTLESKSNQELEGYIKEGNRFVKEANIYAFEILKERGRTFTSAEIERLEMLSNQRKKETEIIIHPLHKNSANLLYIASALGIVNAVISQDIFSDGFTTFIGLIVLGLNFLIAYLVSKGYPWMKYLLLILLLLGFLAFKFIILNLMLNPIIGIVNIIQTILQVIATILLFKIPNQK